MTEKMEEGLWGLRENGFLFSGEYCLALTGRDMRGMVQDMVYPQDHSTSEYLSGYRLTSDGKFSTAKRLVPQCLEIYVIPSQYDNSFRKPGSILMHTRESFGFLSPLVLFAANVDDLVNSKGLNAHQTAFAVNKYKSHHHVRLTSEIVALIQASD
jgi:hypothetical protein